MKLPTTVGLIMGAAALSAAETKVQLKDLPAAVRTTVVALTKSAELRGVSREIEKGKTYYEAETMVNGRSRDLLIDAAGHLVEVEQEVELSSIPEAARTALQKRAGTGKVSKVESVTKGSTVTYEAVIEVNGKKSEAAVSADGTRL